MGRARVGTARWQEPAAFGLAALVLAVLVVPPFAAIAVELLRAGPFHALGPLASLETWALFGRSVALAAAATALATLLGVPLGFLLRRTDLMARPAALLVHVFPLALPPFLLALGWFHAFGRRGALGSDLSSTILFSEAGAAAVLALAFAPAITALTALALDGIDAAIEEAALVVAPPWRVALEILLPVAAPSIGLGALVVFALAFSELGVPMFLRVSTYPAVVFSRLGGMAYSPGEAFALALPLLGLGLALVAIERMVFGRRPLAVLGLQRARAPLPLGRWRAATSVLAWTFVLAAATPIVALGARATQASEWTSWLGASLHTSLMSASAAASVITVLGVLLGRALARGQRGSRALDALAVLAFVAPASALGIGIIASWNHASTAAVYGSAAILVVAAAGRYAVLGLRPIALAVHQSPAHLEEAAAVFGAGFFARIARIVVPVHARAIASAWLLAFIFCLRDLDLGVLFYPPGRETLPIRIFTLEANGPEPVVAALALVQIAITGAAVAIGARRSAR